MTHHHQASSSSSVVVEDSEGMVGLKPTIKAKPLSSSIPPSIKLNLPSPKSQLKGLKESVEVFGKGTTTTTTTSSVSYSSVSSSHKSRRRSLNSKQTMNDDNDDDERGLGLMHRMENNTAHLNGVSSCGSKSTPTSATRHRKEEFAVMMELTSDASRRKQSSQLSQLSSEARLEFKNKSSSASSPSSWQQHGSSHNKGNSSNMNSNHAFENSRSSPSNMVSSSLSSLSVLQHSSHRHSTVVERDGILQSRAQQLKLMVNTTSSSSTNSTTHFPRVNGS